MRVAIVYDALCVRGGAQQAALWMANALADDAISAMIDEAVLGKGAIQEPML